MDRTHSLRMIPEAGVYVSIDTMTHECREKLPFPVFFF